MSKHSYVEIDSSVAIQLATERKRSIDATREKIAQQIIDQEVKQINSGFFRRLFRCKDVTREEAEESELNSEWSELNNTRNWLYKDQYETCNSVLLTARVVNKLTLSLDDYRSISGT